MELKDEQWAVIEPLMPVVPLREDKRGRPRRSSREIMDGILWVLRTGAPWKDIPDRYPPYQTCHRRFQEWNEAGVMDRILEALATDVEKFLFDANGRLGVTRFPQLIRQHWLAR